MNNVFSEKEVEILKLHLQHKKNKEIAEKIEKSEAHVSQALSNIRSKLEKLENSLELLGNLGLVDTAPIHLTETGRKSFKKNLISLETKKELKLLIPKDTSTHFELALPKVPSMSGVVDITPVFGSPHDHLKYTITELVKGIVRPSHESIRELAVRLNVAEDIILEVETTINNSLPNTNIGQYYLQYNNSSSGTYTIGLSDSVTMALWNTIATGRNSTMAWENTTRFEKYPQVYIVGLEHSLKGLPMLSLQLDSSGKHVQQKIITASNVTGDSFGR